MPATPGWSNRDYRSGADLLEKAIPVNQSKGIRVAFGTAKQMLKAVGFGVAALPDEPRDIFEFGATEQASQIFVFHYNKRSGGDFWATD